MRTRSRLRRPPVAAVASFGVERLIEALALDEMRGALGGRQFGAAEARTCAPLRAGEATSS